MKRFKHLTNARSYAFKTRQWIFPDKDGTGYIVCGSMLADELITAGVKCLYSPFSSIRVFTR